MRNHLAGLVAALLVLGAAPVAHAVPENAAHAQRFADEVLPFCLGQWQFGDVTGQGGVRIATASYKVASPKGAIVVVPGRGQPFMAFCETVYDLRDSGYDFYLVDHRGQGWSGRLLDDPERSYVDRFDDYVADLDTVVRTVVQPSRYRRVVALAHSMGGAIATRYAELHPGVFTQLVLSAPMHAVDTKQYPEPFALVLATAATVAGQGGEYAPTQVAPDAAAPFAGNDQTHSTARWAQYATLWQRFPELLVGGSTFRWLKEILVGTLATRTFAFTIDTPVLILQAGDDAYVKAWGQDEVCRRAAHCQRRVFPHAYHDLLNERDPVRDEVLANVREVLLR
jgi:lysophospholipase